MKMKIDGIVFFFYSLAPPLGSDGEWSEEISIDNGQLLRYRRRRILFLGVKNLQETKDNRAAIESERIREQGGIFIAKKEREKEFNDPADTEVSFSIVSTHFFCKLPAQCQ
jgi:hypothetical protein